MASSIVFSLLRLRLKTKVLENRHCNDTEKNSSYWKENHYVPPCNLLVLKIVFLSYFIKKNLKHVAKWMPKVIFDAQILITSYHYLMSTKNPPCLNGEKVETATSMLRAFNHKHRFAIITELLDNGSMNPTRLAANLRLTESYIMEHLLVLQHAGMINSIDKADEVRFVANKRAIRKVNAALRSFVQPF